MRGNANDDSMSDDDARIERNRRGFLNAAANTFGLLASEPRQSDGGWRMARLVDGDFAGWLCDHVHRTGAEAAACERTEPLTGHTVATLADPDSGARTDQKAAIDRNAASSATPECDRCGSSEDVEPYRWPDPRKIVWLCDDCSYDLAFGAPVVAEEVRAIARSKPQATGLDGVRATAEGEMRLGARRRRDEEEAEEKVYEAWVSEFHRAESARERAEEAGPILPVAPQVPVPETGGWPTWLAFFVFIVVPAFFLYGLIEFFGPFFSGR